MADVDLLAREPGEGLVGEIGVGELLQHVARARAGEHQNAPLRRDRVDADAAVGGQRLDQIVVVVPLQRAGRDEVEALRRAAVDGELRADAAILRQQVAEVDAADRLRDAVRHQASRARPRRRGRST